MLRALASSDITLRVATYAPGTEAEGPGRRFAVWVQGCSLRCPGCCNPHMQPRAGGQVVLLDELLDTVAKTPLIEGVTILGGEPTEQLSAVSAFAAGVQRQGLSVMLFSGRTLYEILRMGSAAMWLLANIDILVDGRYVQAKPDYARRWIGSTNQRVYFLSDRYSPDDPRFAEANTVEVRLVSDERGLTVTVNGWPASVAELAELLG